MDIGTWQPEKTPPQKGGGEYFTGEGGSAGGEAEGGGVECSPGSAWKQEPSSVGNWADELQSPRSEGGGENPLHAALQGAKKSLANW